MRQFRIGWNFTDGETIADLKGPALVPAAPLGNADVWALTSYAVFSPPAVLRCVIMLAVFDHATCPSARGGVCAYCLVQAWQKHCGCPSCYQFVPACGV